MSTEQSTALFPALERNIEVLLRNPLVIFSLAVVLIVVLFLIFARRWMIRLNPSAIVVFALLAMAAPVWYCLLVNHSYIHAWFTYRSLAGSVACIVAMLVTSIHPPVLRGHVEAR